MKTFKLYTFILCTSLFTACSDKYEDCSIENELVSAQFRSGVTIQTKVTENSWDQGDKIGIYMVKNKTGFIVGSILGNVWNLPYATEGDGIFTAVEGNETIYYPIDGSKVDFYAYYPYQESMKEIISVPFYNIDTNDQSDLSALDLLYSSNVKEKHKNNPEAVLDFKHILHKITLNILPGTGLTAEDLTDLTVNLKSIYKKGNFNFQSETITITSLLSGDISKKSSYIESEGNEVVQLLVLPQTAGSKTCFEFKLANSGDSYYYSFDADHKFASGQHIEYTVTINKSEAIVKGDITEWDKVDKDPQDIN